MSDEYYKTYAGDPWHADETEDCVRVFRNHLQMIKMPKRDTPYEEYWMQGNDLAWLLSTLNRAEADGRGLPDTTATHTDGPLSIQGSLA